MSGPHSFYALVRLPDGTNLSLKGELGAWFIQAGQERFPAAKAKSAGAEWAERNVAPPFLPVAYETLNFFEQAFALADKAAGK